MSKVLQVKVSREELMQQVNLYIQRKVSDACKKQRIDEQIAEEVDQATIEVTVPAYEERISQLELAMDKLLNRKKKEDKNGPAVR